MSGGLIGRINPLRWTLVLLAVAVLSGCLMSDAPVITGATAEDVGASLSYAAHSDRGPPHTGVRLVRTAPRSYRFEIYDVSGRAEGSLVMSDTALVRRIGLRGEAPIFAIQVDMADAPDPDLAPEELGFRYLVYLVAIDARGVGIAVVMDCLEVEEGLGPDIRPLAAAHGLRVTCPSTEVTSPFRIEGEPPATQVWAFLQDLLTTTPLAWEDGEAHAVLDEIE